MTPAEKAAKWKKQGLCHKCGLVQTHRREFKIRLKALTNDQVYKGICLRCHSITEAKTRLNEQVNWGDHHRTSESSTAVLRPTTQRTVSILDSPTCSGSRHSPTQSLRSEGTPQSPGLTTNINRAVVSPYNSGAVTSSPRTPPRNPKPNLSESPITRFRVVGTNRTENPKQDGDEFASLQVPPLVGGLQHEVSELTFENSVRKSYLSGDRDGSLGKILEESEASDQNSRSGNGCIHNSNLSSSFSIADHGGRNMSGMERIEARIMAKIAEENNRRMASASAAASTSSAGNNHARSKSQVEQESAKVTDVGHTRSLTGGEFLTGKGFNSSDAEGRDAGSSLTLEERLRFKSRENGVSKSSPEGNGNIGASDSFHERLRSKTQGNRGIRSSDSAGGNSDTSSSFEEKLRLKSKGGHVVHSSNSMGGDSKVSESLDDRMPLKPIGDRIVHSPAAGGNDGNTSGNFEERLRMKSNGGHVRHSSNSMGSDSDVSSSFEERLRLKSKGSDSKKLEERLRLKSKGSWEMDNQPKHSVPRVENKSDAPNDDCNKYMTLLRKKQETENARLVESRKTSFAQQMQESPSIVPGVVSRSAEESQICSNLSDCTQKGQFDEIINILKINPSSPSIVAMALESLRDCLSHDDCPIHGFGTYIGNETVHSNRRSTSNRGWIKIITMTLSSHLRNQVIQLEGLKTIWAIISLYSHLISELASNPECLDAIISAMETHIDGEAVQEIACGLIASLAGYQKYALILADLHHGVIVQRLIFALRRSSRTGSPQENVLKALFRLSSAILSTDTTMESHFLEKTVNHAGNKFREQISLDIVMTSIINSMKQYPANNSLQIWGVRCLWNLISPSARHGQGGHSSIVSEFLRHVRTVTKAHPDTSLQAFYELVICFLSKVSSSNVCLHGCVDNFSSVLLDIMKVEKKSSTVAIHGCRSIYNLCSHEDIATSSRLVISSLHGVDVVINTMEIFPEHVILQREACMALAGLSVDCMQNTEKILELGGVARIDASFDAYCVSRFDESSLQAKIGACIALTSLATYPAALSAIRDAGIVKRIVHLMEEEDVPDKLQNSMKTLLESCSEFENVSAKLQEGADREQCCMALLANLRDVLPPSVIQRDKATWLRSIALHSMNAYTDSAHIQAMGCTLLSHVYVAFSTDSIGQARDIENIINALKAHTTCSTVVSSACMAARNLCSSLTQQMDSVDCDKLNIILDVMDHYRDDLDVIEQSSGALFALCTSSKNLGQIPEDKSIFTIIIESLQKHPHSVELYRCCIGLLWSFSSISGRVEEFVPNLVPLLLKSLDMFEEDDEMIDLAVNALLILSKGGFQSVLAMLKHETFIDSIISCMFKFIDTPRSHSIQTGCCDILSNLALDNYLRADMCARGGTSRIIMALNHFCHDHLVVCTALFALANLISGADVEILRGSEISKTIVKSMQSHPINLTVQVRGASALWVLSSRNEVFKERIVQYGGAQVVSEAMTRFVASETMQSKGSIALWSLAVHRSLKAQVGQSAVCVVNGLAAHVCSEKLCEECVGAIKCLSIDEKTKKLLGENDALDLIFSAMCLYSENATIQQSALAALSNLSVDVNANQVLRISSDDLDTITNGMRTHPKVKDIQESAIIVLRNFTCSPSNCLILQQDAHLPGLIRSAVVNFNDSFQGRAEGQYRMRSSFSLIVRIYSFAFVV